MIYEYVEYFFPSWESLNDEFNSNMSDGLKGRTSKRLREEKVIFSPENQRGLISFWGCMLGVYVEIQYVIL